MVPYSTETEEAQEVFKEYLEKNRLGDRIKYEVDNRTDRWIQRW